MLEKSVEEYLATLAPGKFHAMRLPAKPRYPAFVYTPISAVDTLKLEGGVTHTVVRIQVDAWGKSYISTKTLAQALRDGLSGFSGDFHGTGVRLIRVEGGPDIYEGEADLYRIITDLLIHIS